MTIKTFSSTLHPTARLSDMLSDTQESVKPQTDCDYRDAAAAGITVIRWLHNPGAYDAYDIYTAIRTLTLAEAGVVND